MRKKKIADTRINIIRSREIFWVTSNIYSAGVLINADIVHQHRCRELEILKVYHIIRKAERHPQVHQYVLRKTRC
jgi:hypothetical protein